MRISQIASTDFRGAGTMRILAAENKQVSKLTNIVMAATSVYGPFRSGTILYKLGKEIEINDPAKGLAEHLQKLGIKYHL